MWRAVAKPYFYNINKIFPTKQKYVSKLVEECKKDPNVKRVIIFGSAVLARCNLWSDIDVYFEFEKPPTNYPTIGEQKQVFDKFCNFGVSETFLDEITKKGVVVYERPQKQ